MTQETWTIQPIPTGWAVLDGNSDGEYVTVKTQDDAEYAALLLNNDGLGDLRGNIAEIEDEVRYAIAKVPCDHCQMYYRRAEMGESGLCGECQS